MSNPRMSVTFTKPQFEDLSNQAAAEGITIAELVRRIVDKYRIPYEHAMPRKQKYQQE